MTMKQTIVHIGVLLCIAYTRLLAQSPSADPTQDILPPSPTAASLTKYVDFPVNTSTGTPDISVPLHVLSGNGVSVPISLSYHAGGIKLDEVSNNVGLGWSLSAGGVINRTIMGKADEATDGFMTRGNDVPIPPINSNTEFTAMQAFAQGNWDGQPDLFQFSCGGYSGKFVFDDANTVRLIPKQDVRITYTTCTGAQCPANVESGSIISFTVTTPDGVKYLFGTSTAIELSKSVNYNVSGSTSCRAKEFTIPQVTAWYLKTITNPRTGDVVTLTYADNQVNYDVNYNESYKVKDPSSNTNCLGNTITSKCVSTKTEWGKQLISISSSKGRVDFIDGGTRSDITIVSGSCRIGEVKIYGKNDTLLRSFQLKQAFVQASGTTPSTAATTKYRMYLDTLKELSATGAQVNAWNFSYYNRASLAPRLSYKQDHWGFFNNKNNTQLAPAPDNTQISALYMQSIIPSYTPANRDPDPAYSYYGTLQRVTYPTGGYTEYQYEGNELAVCNQVNVEAPGYQSAALTYSGTEQTQTVNFNIDHDQYVNVSYHVIMNGVRCAGASAAVKKVDINNPFQNQTWGGCGQLTNPVDLQGSPYILMPAGDYQLEVKVFQGSAGAGYPAPNCCQPESASISVQFIDYIPTYMTNKPTGGIRVKQATTNDGVGVSPNIVKVYKYDASSGCAGSSSAYQMGSTPIYHTWEFETITSPLNYLCSYHRVSSSSITSLVNHAGAIVNYGEVWELLGANGENGKNYFRHQVFQDQQYVTDPLAFQYQLFLGSPTSDYSWKNGRVVEEKSLNAQGQTVSQKLYDYEFSEATNQNVIKMIAARQAYNPIGTVNYNTNPNTAMESYVMQWTDVVSQFVYLKKTTERIYNSDGSANYVEKVTDYQYDLPAMRHLMPVNNFVTNSDGVQYGTRVKYAQEYTASPATDVPSVAIKFLQDSFIIVPVETVQTIKKPAGSEMVTGGSVTRFKNFGGNKVFPNEIWQLGTTAPISSFTYSSISGGNFSQASPYYQTRVLGAYDTYGNLLEWNKTDDQVSSFIYWKGINAPMAYVRNALSTEIAYTSFEDVNQTAAANNGNWAISGTGGWNSTAGFYYTGKNGYNISTTHTITRTGVPAGSYVVSFFYRDGIVAVNGVNGSASANATWQYAEVPLTLAGGSNTVTVTGAAGAYIDELRLQPADALMRTFSLDNSTLQPLSVADEGSVPAHFEYDKSQRLQVVRDQDRNILQTYEYNYQQAGAGINDIKARTVLVTGQTTTTQVNALSGSNVRRIFQYFDGLGRPIQSNAVGQSPAQKDIISIEQYDAFGREPKSFLPYTATTNSGAYTAFGTASAAQTAFANGFSSGGYGYSENVYEPSRLNRVKEQGAPGASFRAGNGHTREIVYRGNSASLSDTIRDFTNNIFFATNKLTVTQETDENERKKFTFTDNLGRVVLVKQQLANTPANPHSNTDYALTYTIYDDFGRVAAVIPPTASKMMATFNIWTYTNTMYSNMIYKYTYDSRGRLATKTVPSNGTTTLYYDRLDRPVLSQDANGNKGYTRFDILGRPIISGRYKGSATPGMTGPLFETPNTSATQHYYTATTFPVDSFDVYKVTYYDDYDFDNSGTLTASETYTNPAESGYETTAFMRVRGKSTATKTAILNTNSAIAPTSFLITRSYYDKEFSVIQVNKQNHLSGTDITSSTYDFANRLIKTRRDHTATVSGSAKAYTIREEYEYDHAGRMKYVYHQIGSQKKEILSKTAYDEMGRMSEKNLHCSNFNGTALPATQTYLQSLDFAYNIRGWLKGINDVSTCTAQSGDDLADLFSMALEYDTNSLGNLQFYYNGNISAMQWRTNINGTCGTRQLYSFGYDAANRLTAAAHRSWNGSAWTDPGQYNESNITYDLNGNLKTYTRQGLITAPNTFGTIDNLTYNYDDGARPDRLSRVIDAGNTSKGFIQTSTASPQYSYDSNGNMTQDRNKDLSIGYNFMNLPNRFAKSNGDSMIIQYTADGEKLSKFVAGVVKNYVSGIEYNGANIESIYHSEGRCTPNGANFYYEYTLKDHLGNARVNFRANGTAIVFLDEHHYYPFGMEMEGSFTGGGNPYRYNGKEMNGDLGLNWLNFGARWYDPAVGRWWNVDPLASSFPAWNAYVYGKDNPIRFVDPNGRAPKDPPYYKYEQTITLKAEMHETFDFVAEFTLTEKRSETTTVYTKDKSGGEYFDVTTKETKIERHYSVSTRGKSKSNVTVAMDKENKSETTTKTRYQALHSHSGFFTFEDNRVMDLSGSKELSRTNTPSDEIKASKELEDYGGREAGLTKEGDATTIRFRKDMEGINRTAEYLSIGSTVYAALGGPFAMLVEALIFIPSIGSQAFIDLDDPEKPVEIYNAECTKQNSYDKN